MTYNKLQRNKLLFDISCVLILLISCFCIVSIILGRTSFSSVNEEKWDGVSVASSFSGGNGTEDNPYVISNGNEFIYFKNLIEGEQNSYYSNLYYQLDNDINLDFHNFSGIGTTDRYFSGTFDGNGYTIKNTKIITNTYDDVDYYGLFTKTVNAKIINLNLNAININAAENTNPLKIGIVSGESISLGDDSTTSEMLGSISNISIVNSFIDLTDSNENKDSMIASISGFVDKDIDIRNIYVNASINTNYSNQISKLIYKVKSDTYNIISNVTDSSIISNDLSNYTISDGVKIENNYEATISSDKIILKLNDKSINLDDVIYDFNEYLDLKYYWEVFDNNFIITIEDTPNVSSNEMINSFAFGKSAPIALHDSGTDGNTIYVNDLDADLKYYTGKNYTANNGAIPTADNKNLYNSSTLVKVYTMYNGTDYSDSSLTGHVNLDEQESNYVYYNYYPVEDGCVNFTLIDNPYADRPNNKGFNGWVTDYYGAVISYDSDYYERNVKIPVTYSNGIPNDISITFNANWIDAKVSQKTSGVSWNDAFSNLDNSGLQAVYGTATVYNYDIDSLYFYGTIDRYESYPSGSVNYNGNSLTGSCNSRRGCTFYQPANFTGNGNYYYFNGNVMQNVYVYSTTTSVADVSIGSNAAGYFKGVTISRNDSLDGYYDSEGNALSGTCNSNSCSYYELVQMYDSSGNVNVIQAGSTYYYLATRDTNIIVLRSNTSDSFDNDKPFTLTSVHNGNDYRNYYWNVSSIDVHCMSDTRIENVYIYTTQGSVSSTSSFPSSASRSKYLYADYNNLKIGRGLKKNGSYVNFIAFIGGSNSAGNSSSSNILKYKLIVESGYYSSGATLNGGIGTTSVYAEAKAIYGSDYDRIKNDDTQFIVTDCLAGAWGGNNYASSNYAKSIDAIFKSGNYGSRKGANTSGIYVGQRQGGNAAAMRSALIQGGTFFVINGGPSVATNMRTINSVNMDITGGEITMLFAGAGQTTTYGNRIVSMTGGKILYSLFGGSNAYNNSSGAGTIYGSSYVYVGGDAQVGDTAYLNSTLYNTNGGNVFGHGDGANGSTAVGSNDNSTVIIDGDAHILNNVYGGSNNGQAGSTSNVGTTSTIIKIKGGTINGSVYGGGNNNGIGSSSVTANIDIDVTGGNVVGSVYGGTRSKGIIYGSVDMDVIDGTVTNVYGGGEGGYVNTSSTGTFVNGNIDVTIGSVNSGPKITGSVYGGSAMGTVNASTYNASANSKTVLVTVNNGIVKGGVFGGAKGSSSITPYIKGNITVNINGGNVANVYGANDVAGIPEGTSNVYLNGGVVGSAFGGGNEASIPISVVHLKGSNVGSIFGGSNTKGSVTTSNVNINGNNVTDNVFGGGYKAITVTSNVTLNNASVPNIYGGGNEADVSTANVNIKGGSSINVYGGGNLGNVETSEVNMESGTVTTLYGGGNEATVNNTNVSIDGGTITTVYGGGNKAAGVVNNSTNVTMSGGVVTTLYGGGNLASVPTSNITTNGGTITTVYGGGNRAGVTTTNPNIYGGTITEVYGGSNVLGDVTTSNVKIGNSNNSFIDVKTEVSANDTHDWESTEYDTLATVNVTVKNNSTETINDWAISLGIPNSVIYSNYSNSNINAITGGYSIDSVNRYYGYNSLEPGGSYTFTFTILSNVAKENFIVSSNVLRPGGASSLVTVGDVYGGNNHGGKTTNSNVNTFNAHIDNVYGGGDKAVVDASVVTVKESTIENVYGGGNLALVNTNSFVDIDDSTITTNVYGGGNEGSVTGNTNVYATNSNILGSLYAGGNGRDAVVSGNTSVYLDGDSVIGYEGGVIPTTGCVFGSGNAAATGVSGSTTSKSNVNIVGGEVYGNVYGGANTSVVYGKAYTNIGMNATTDNTLVESNINIHGTVFGGGEANANGSESYDYSFISVTDGIDVNINGNGYIDNGHDFLITGSIFGSGNASSSSGTSNITIKDLGTKTKPSTNVSIQRANKVVLDNSVIQLSGTTDRTNEYSTIKYSFNRIDSLTVKNNTILLLQQNANLLKEFNSMVDVGGSEVAATVSIDDDTKTVSKNVDNRVYLIPNRNLNITTNEAASSFGKVTGMTFFGMYNTYAAGSYSYGVYDRNVDYGDTGNASMALIGGSYVLGLHSNDHDITKDGFYSNYLTDDYSEVYTAYIEPSPPSASHYMWTIGMQAVNYSLTLNASKYSSLGTYELSMLDFSAGDTTFNVLGFNSEGLGNGVSLVDSNTVPKVTNTSAEANKVLGLSMKSETREWTSYGTTKLLSEGTGTYTGTNSYKTDSQKLAPSMMFYLYHAKNITLNGELGTVVVTLQALTPKNEIEYDVQLITITIDITARNYDDGDAYDASITYDKKYEMPAATNVNITNQSQFTSYYSLFAEAENFESFYGNSNSNYHALVTDYVLPVGTQITMLDYGVSEEDPEYYYYTVTQSMYNNKLAQFNSDGEVVYKLSDFIKMGSTSTNNTYDDKIANKKYYSNEYNRTIEEFVFIFDLKETTATGDHVGNSMLFELRNNEDRALVTVLGIRQNLMHYNLYDSSNMVLQQTVNNSSNYLYYDVSSLITYATNVDYDQTDNREAIINTNFESSAMGLNVSLFDNTGNQVSSSLLSGTSIRMDNKNHFADSDGVFRINLSGKVSNLNKNLYLITDSQLPSGVYKLRFVLFASDDGLHNADLSTSAINEYQVTVVGDDNAIVVDVDDKDKIVSAKDKLTENKDNVVNYKTTLHSVLSQPNVRVDVYKRDTSSINSNDYQEVDFYSVFGYPALPVSFTGHSTLYQYEYMLSTKFESKTNYDFPLVDTLTSGTYKVVFRLYDNNQLIEEENKYLIVTDDVN